MFESRSGSAKAAARKKRIDARNRQRVEVKIYERFEFLERPKPQFCILKNSEQKYVYRQFASNFLGGMSHDRWRVDFLDATNVGAEAR